MVAVLLARGWSGGRGRGLERKDTGEGACAKLLAVHDDADNEAVESEGLGKDEDEDESDVDAGLLGKGTDTCVANDANGEASSKPREPNSEPCTHVEVGVGYGILVGLHGRRKDNGHNQSVDTHNPSHHHRNQRTHHNRRVAHTHSRDSSSSLGRSISRPKTLCVNEKRVCESRGKGGRGGRGGKTYSLMRWQQRRPCGP